MSDTVRVLQTIRQEAFRSLAAARAVGLVALLTLILASPERVPELRPYTPLLLAYLVFAVFTWTASYRGWAQGFLSYGIPAVDLPACFVLQLMTLSARLPMGGAGWSVGLFALLVVLAALTFNRAIIIATSIGATFAVGRLQRVAGAGLEDVLASVGLLAAIALVCGWAVWRFSQYAQEAALQEAERRAELEEAAAAAEADRTIARANADVSTAAITEAQEAIVRVNAYLNTAKEDAEVRTALLVHDMKGPLTALRGVLEFVDPRAGRKIEGESLTEGLSLALSAAGRLERMIIDLLAVARLDRGVSPVTLRETSVAPLLSRIASTYRASARCHGVELSASAQTELVARIDASLVERALENLVTNALRFVQTGNHIQLCAEVGENGLRLMVRNNGPRIPTEVQAMLFQRTTSGAPSREAGNGGLGLYLCRLVAEAHGGSVALEEDAAWPVSFVLSIPEASLEVQLARSRTPCPQSVG